MRDGALRGVRPNRSGRRRCRQVDCRSSQPLKETGEAMSRNLHRDEIAKTLLGWSEIFLTTPSAPSSERSLFLTRRSHPSSGGGESQRLRCFRCVFNSLHWILLAVLAFAPTAFLARQAPQTKTEAAQAQTEKPQVTTEELKKEDAQKQTEAQPKTEEDSKLKSVPGGKALGMTIL